MSQPPLSAEPDLSTVDLRTETVRTERLALRPHRAGDADAVFAACQDRETLIWLPALPSPYTRADAADWVTRLAPGERADGLGMPVAIEAAGQLVGSAGVHLRPGRLGPEIGWWTAPQARRRGYAAEAAHALAAWALRLGAARVHAFVDVDNTASAAVARRAGFTEEGRVRAALQRRDGSWADALLFSRLPGD
ncbi:GNAT family N-acetyltransferase [Modestobacter lapidis]|nr:GNAT family N-acetyltransferase [Modestobacter lapidis]